MTISVNIERESKASGVVQAKLETLRSHELYLIGFTVIKTYNNISSLLNAFLSH